MRGFGRRLACTLGMALLVGSTAFAHPGHGRGGGDFSALHYLTEPDHALFAITALLAAAVAAGYGARLFRSKTRQRP
jgi:hydrogenase/urease accessory protein HupE